jgi:hypothetical protein
MALAVEGKNSFTCCDWIELAHNETNADLL